MDFAGVGEAGFFFDGKGVEFGAEHDGRAGSVLEDGDNAGAADCFGDFVAQGAETSGEFGGGLVRARRAREIDEDRGRDRGGG